VVGLAGPYDFLPLREPSARRVFGHAKDLAATQPVNLAHAGGPAFFLATGEDDTVVPPRETRALAKALLEAGARVVARDYPGVGHNEVLLALAKPFRDDIGLFDDITAFLQARTGGAFTALSGSKPAESVSQESALSAQNN
jgi:acetyl esterase/lipase